MITDFITPGTTGFAAICLAAYLLLANGLAYAAFAMDKSRAVAARQRIPERSLLILATLGGWIGAKMAQRRLCHKTRKQPFGILLNLSALVMPGLLATALILQADLDWTALGAEVSSRAQSLFASDGGDIPLPRRFGPGSDAAAP